MGIQKEPDRVYRRFRIRPDSTRNGQLVRAAHRDFLGGVAGGAGNVERGDWDPVLRTYRMIAVCMHAVAVARWQKASKGMLREKSKGFITRYFTEYSGI